MPPRPSPAVGAFFSEHQSCCAVVSTCRARSDHPAPVDSWQVPGGPLHASLAEGARPTPAHRCALGVLLPGSAGLKEAVVEKQRWAIPAECGTPLWELEFPPPWELGLPRCLAIAWCADGVQVRRRMPPIRGCPRKTIPRHLLRLSLLLVANLWRTSFFSER